MTRPPRHPLGRFAVIVLGLPTLVTLSLVVAYVGLRSDPSPRPRGPTVAIARADLPDWIREHDRFVARVRAGRIPLLFLGDSITRGWLVRAAADGGGAADLWHDLYEARHAENFGIDGDHVEHLLWRLRHGELSGGEPTAVVLLIGTNNIGLDPPEAIAAGIASVVEEVHRRCPRTQVLLLGLLPRGITPGHGRPPAGDRPDPRIAEVNRLIAPLGERPRVTYLDFGDRLLDPDGRLDRAIQPDYLHLSRRGYEIWAAAMEPTLRSLLETPGRKNVVRRRH